MRARWIWIGAVLLYGAFSLWYVNWRGPLAPAEVDRFVELARERTEVEPERLETLRAFLEADDGGEFFMLNLIRLNPEPITMPDAAAPESASDVLARYTGYFMPALLARAGHPAFFGRAAGGYLEHWGVEPDPGWTISGVIRYRSRRDMVELATNPAFSPAHDFKVAAILNTLAFPVSPGFVVVGPRIWVALVLGLLAAMAQLALQARHH